MRTTLTLDNDVIDKARKIGSQSKRPFKTIVNEALRVGLTLLEKPFEKKKYRTQARTLGLRSGYSLDNIQELLAQAEEENCR